MRDWKPLSMGRGLKSYDGNPNSTYIEKPCGSKKELVWICISHKLHNNIHATTKRYHFMLNVIILSFLLEEPLIDHM